MAVMWCRVLQLVMASEKRKNLSIDEKIDVLLCLEKGEKMSVVAKRLGIPPITHINLEYVNVLKCYVMNFRTRFLEFRTRFLEMTENEVGIVKNRVLCGVSYSHWQISADVHHTEVISRLYAYIEPQIFQTIAGGPGNFDICLLYTSPSPRDS